MDNICHQRAQTRETTLFELVGVFARIGLLSFGGPAGQIALMHRVLVEEKSWLDEERFLHALNFCMLLPGPEAMQLATYAGWLKRGTVGAVVAGSLFVLPGFLVLIALSTVYVAYGDLPAVQALLFGLSAAVLAIVVEALLRVSKRALKHRAHVVIAISAFLAIALARIPFPAIIALAAFVGWASLRQSSEIQVHTDAKAGDAIKAGVKAVMVWGALWSMPLGLLIWLDKGQVLAQMALFFSQAAIVTFGGAYAVLAYVGDQAVNTFGWLRADEMVTGLGFAETTPGPLILVLVFVGFVGASRLTDFSPLNGGLLGATTALWFTFIPCFLWILAGAPFMERLRGNASLAAALSGVTAAVVGVIANLALWFSLQVLFGQTDYAEVGFLFLPVIDLESLDWKALAIAVAAGVALLRYHVNLIAVLFASALAGYVLNTTSG